jgi:aldehyde dehydrogenase (NAD+)
MVATATVADISALFARQQTYRPTVARTSTRERIAKLDRLHAVVLEHETRIQEALFKDFRKGTVETDISEISIVTKEIRDVKKHLYSWMQPERVGTPLPLFGSSSEIRYDPKGVTLVIAPWNYPINLSLVPLVSAIAAGNCVILKPSEMAPHSAAVIRSIVEACFQPDEVAVVEGDAEVAKALLALPFDHIFFTGSPAIGRVVMANAAKHLTSVTLELGGKSPVVVDDTADLDTAASKIGWLKTMNAGQICIAPDYLLVQETVQDALLQKMVTKWEKFYGNTPEARKSTPDFCRIINQRHFDRVLRLLEDAVDKGASVAFGGRHDRSECYIEPTILTGVTPDMAIWEEEIFGPILPVRTIKNVEEAAGLINQKPHALAMYIFSNNHSNTEFLLRETRTGNVTINDCATHFFNGNLPFGGVGNSGLGKCHGIYGFREFSNARGILRQTRFFPSTDQFLPPYNGVLLSRLLTAVKRWL